LSLRLADAGMPEGGPLFRAYAGAATGGPATAGPPGADEPVKGFFDYHPWDPGAPLRRATAVDREFEGDRRELSRALLDLASRLGGGAVTEASAARVSRPGSLVVVTGQQAGLLTGPLYTILKAATAAALARRLEAQLERPVIPVFWAATEDHDLVEANAAWIQDREGRWRKICCALPGRVEGLSVGAVPLPESTVAGVLSALRSLLPSGRWTSGALELAGATGRESATLGEWFCRLAQGLLGPLGVVVLDPMDPPLRRLAAKGVARVIAESPRLASALGKGIERVRRRGYEPQVAVDPQDAQLFMYPDGPRGPRRALRRDAAGPGFHLRGNGASFSQGELAGMALRDPELFSGNVVTRPLLQDFALPTVAYVAGPAEVAYFGQYKEAYGALGLTMPLVWPRLSLTLVEPAITRLLGRHGLGPGTVPGGVASRREQLLREGDPIGIEALFQGLREGLNGSYAGVVERLAAMDEVLGHLARQNRGRVAANVDWLERKARQVLRQRGAVGLGQLDRIEAALWPRGGPQERLANVFPFLARWGPGLLDEVSGLAPGPPFAHRYAYLE